MSTRTKPATTTVATTAPKATTAPAATTKATTAPTATETATKALVALVTGPDALAPDALTEAVHNAIRPLAPKARDAVKLALLSDGPFMLAGDAPKALVAITTAPTGPDPKALVAALLADATEYLAALVYLADATWPEAGPAASAATFDRAVTAITKARDGRTTATNATREKHGRTLAELVAAGGTTVTAKYDGITYTATVTATTVTVAGLTYEALSPAAKAIVGSDRDGWSFWHLADGRTAKVAVDAARAAGTTAP